MARTISIGAQGFADIRRNGYFYIDKTGFAQQWWTSGDTVTLLCRPRRFGKTLNMSMLECLFSTRYAGRADLFEGLAAWEDPTLRAEQGAWPVVSLSFSGAKGGSLDEIVARMCERIAFDAIVRGWFEESAPYYNGLVRALLAGDLDAMNAYMNEVALDTFSLFDAGRRPAEREPERFYHGFVLGLLVELRGRYRVTSNRESGFGRYDVMLEPTDPAHDDGIVIEFKVRDPRREASLEETVASAQAQIAKKRYAAELEARGVPTGSIRTYGFAFEGKTVLIG